MYAVILVKTGRILKTASCYSDIVGHMQALVTQGPRMASAFSMFRLGYEDESPWVEV